MNHHDHPSARLARAVLVACLCALFTLLPSGCKKARPVTIRNHASLPALQQRQDFSADYNGRASDVMQQVMPPVAIPYDRLDTDVAVGLPMVGGVRGTYWAYGFQNVGGNPNIVEPDPNDPNDPTRPFHGKPGGSGDTSDWDDIAMGNMHCAPTCAAMVLSYWAAEKGKPNLIQGLPAGAAGSKRLISLLAEAQDTNDQNAAVANGDNHGYFGTFGDRGQAGIASYAQSVGYNLVMSREPFDFDKYKQSIGRDEPVIISFRNPGEKIGHVVVGYGYKGDTILYKDPWDGAVGEKPKAHAVAATTVASSGGRTYGQATPPLPMVPSRADQDWIDVIALTIENVTP